LNADEAFRDAKLLSDGKSYRILRLPASEFAAATFVLAQAGDAFAALIADGTEVTLVLPAQLGPGAVANVPADLEGSNPEYRLITFGAVLDQNMIGFMARVSAVLADAGVPIFPYAAYTTDHLLVPADKFDTAIAALNRARNT
jgi:hypothetical protein